MEMGDGIWKKWQIYRCDYMPDGTCCAVINDACICNQLAYQKAKNAEYDVLFDKLERYSTK